MGNNQSNHFPHIPGKITWYGTRLSTVNHRPFLSDFFLRGGAVCTQATLKMTMKDVNDSNVEDHYRIKAKEQAATMTMTMTEPKPEPITLTIAITMTMSLTLTTMSLTLTTTMPMTTTTTTTTTIIMLTIISLKLTIAIKMMIAMTRKYRWVQCRESQKFRNGKRLFPFSNRANTRQKKVVSIAVNLLCKKSSQPTNESFCQ